MLFIIILNILYASTFTIGKLLLINSGPIFVTGLRMALGGLSLLVYSLFIKKEKIKNLILTKQNIIDLVQIIIIGNFISYVFDFIALKHTTSIKVSFLYNLTTPRVPVEAGFRSNFVAATDPNPTARTDKQIIKFITIFLLNIKIS